MFADCTNKTQSAAVTHNVDAIVKKLSFLGVKNSGDLANDFPWLQATLSPPSHPPYKRKLIMNTSMCTSSIQEYRDRKSVV